ncbi:hypothetical protein G6F65_018976 [Rhizopus arrhizus]|nr:hypothetical protein G6F65_018976 [Rhizopus arrhizus]
MFGQGGNHLVERQHDHEQQDQQHHRRRPPPAAPPTLGGGPPPRPRHYRSAAAQCEPRPQQQGHYQHRQERAVGVQHRQHLRPDRAGAGLCHANAIAPQHRQDAQREGQQQGDAIEQAPPRGTRLAREQPVQAAQQQEPGQEQQQRQPGHCRLHVIAPEARGHHAMGAVPR